MVAKVHLKTAAMAEVATRRAARAKLLRLVTSHLPLRTQVHQGTRRTTRPRAEQLGEPSEPAAAEDTILATTAVAMTTIVIETVADPETKAAALVVTQPVLPARLQLHHRS